MSRKFVQTTQAASLLNLCPQRVRKLLKQGRIKGAFKDKKGFWQIPLYWNVPQVIPAERGQEGTWRKRFVKKSIYIHVRQDRLQQNRKYKTDNPVVTIRSGNHLTYCHEAVIEGICRIVYQPHRPLSCGATLWIELEPMARVKSKTRTLKESILI
jgi:hypothetical protein